MTQDIFLRLMQLIRLHWKGVLLAGFVFGAGSGILGLMSPYIFRSEAIIQIQGQRVLLTEKALGFDHLEFNKSVVRITSPLVLDAVAKELLADPSELIYAFPLTAGILDFSDKMRVVANRIGVRSRYLASTSLKIAQVSPDVIASALRVHLKVEPDASLGTVRFLYRAGTPDLAQRILSSIVNHFIEAEKSISHSNLRTQQKYLESVLQQEMEGVKVAEQEMQDIVEKFPQMALGRTEQSGASILAREFIERQDSVKKLEREFDANRKALETIRRDLSSSDGFQFDVNEEVRTKVINELTQLELKYVQYTTISGYDKKHPEVVKIRGRIETLKKTLDRLREKDPRGGSQSVSNGATDRDAVKNLFRQAEELREKNRRLKSEREGHLRDLMEQKEMFKSSVKVNFILDSLIRSLNAHSTIVTDLTREYQKLSLSLAGLSAAAYILSPPSLSVLAINLSIPKQVFFSSFLGIFIAISFLFLIDMTFPRVLLTSDLTRMGIKPFGEFEVSWASLNRVAYSILSLGHSGDGTALDRSGKVVAFYSFGFSRSVFSFLQRIIQILQKEGLAVAVVGIGIAELDGLGDTPFVSIEGERAYYQIPKTILELRKRNDWVFVLGDDEIVPVQYFANAAVDFVFFVAKLGGASLRSIEEIKVATTHDGGPRHFGVLFRPRAFKFMPFRWLFPTEGRAA